MFTPLYIYIDFVLVVSQGSILKCQVFENVRTQVGVCNLDFCFLVIISERKKDIGYIGPTCFISYIYFGLLILAVSFKYIYKWDYIKIKI